MRDSALMMKRFALAAMALLAGCDKPATPPAPSPGGPPAAAPAAPAPTPTPAPVVIADKSALLDFSYQWPAKAAAIPPLDAWLRADAATARRDAISGAEEDKKARPADAPFFAHEMHKTWTVEGEADGLLALRGEFAEFTGGAHGMSGFQTILWNRATGREIALSTLFTDWNKAQAVLKGQFCPALDEARAAKRGAPVKPNGQWDTACPDIAKQVLLPSDIKGDRFTSIRVLIAPYEAGPYAEGTYDVVLPVTPALVDLLAPSRRPAFAAR